MRLNWFLSIYDSVQNIDRNHSFDNTYYSKNVVIDSESMEASFKTFYKSKAFEGFASKTKNLYWYYYDENNDLFAYGMPYYLEDEL